MVESKVNEKYGTKVFACYETDLTPYEGRDTLIAIFDTEEAAKEYVSRMDKAYGGEYWCYTYEVFYLNQPIVE